MVIRQEQIKRILVINPGSTSTKLAFFEDDKCVYDGTMDHDKATIESFDKVADQMCYRYENVCRWIEDKHIDMNDIDAIAARGGMLRPVKSGAFQVNDKMIDDLLSAEYGEHASNLGAPLARKFAEDNNIDLCMIVNPTCVDELSEYARLSGSPLLPNISKFHALNQKYVARKVAEELGMKYAEGNFIVAHMGGGISIGVHCKGEAVHVNNGLDGTGPFSPERAGTIPRFQLIEMCYSSKYTEEELKRLLNSEGGLFAYLGSNDVREIENAADAGDAKSKFCIEAMCYQIAREIGAGSTVLKGNCDAIVLTGGLAYSSMVVNEVTERVSHIAPVFVSPGSDENKSLAEAALMVLNGTEEIKVY